MDVQEVREARGKGVVAFAKFCQDRNFYNNCLFCFLEGEDDFKYYSSRIEKYAQYDYGEIIHYNCCGRKEVLKAYDLIKNKKIYDRVNKIFLIDRDYFPLRQTKKDIYQTPCYSIENFYISSKCFSKILNREFGINVSDADYQKCINDFEKRKEEFHKKILFFNAWLYYQMNMQQKKQDHRICIRDYKIAKLFSSIEIDELKSKFTIDLSFLKKEFPNAYNVRLSTIEKICHLFNKNNCQQLFRGKFELDFLSRILNSLKIKNQNGTYFTTKRTSVELEPHTNLLSSLSEYADTPNDLILFLEEHKK